MTLTVGSLFSGIGGIDLGLERAGHKVIWQSEIDPYSCRVLKKHWPTVQNLGDITKIDWGKVERPNIICGGYPCQPFSNAGKRNGTNDIRHLWPAMHNAICLLRPEYALMENVRGHLSLGFGQVLADLATIGYDAEWQVIPAAAVGAPHKRNRVFIVAYSNSSRLKRNRQPCRQETEYTVFASSDTHCEWHNSKKIWQTEPNVGRVAHGIPDRVDRLRGLGNAVVPQVAELVGRLIGKHAAQFK